MIPSRSRQNRAHPFSPTQGIFFAGTALKNRLKSLATRQSLGQVCVGLYLWSENFVFLGFFRHSSGVGNMSIDSYSLESSPSLHTIYLRKQARRVV
jgi:hypothetical protein